MEKIRVCVRKRPLGMKEIRRGEINIITIEDEETLLVHEKKEAVDLTQYILQVWCFLCLELLLSSISNFCFLFEWQHTNSEIQFLVWVLAFIPGVTLH